MGARTQTTPERRRLMGRLAAVLFLCSSGIVLATLPALPPDASVPGTVAVSIAAVALGAAAWIAPWERWPQWASLVLVPPAFGLIAFGNLYGGGDERAYGVFFVVAFVWIGLAHRSWTSLAVAPIAGLAYAAPLGSLPGLFVDKVVSGVTTIAACVMVGEALSWGATRLARTEQALEEHQETTRKLRELDQMKTTFMSTVSHELRTPITICRGHLEVLRDDPTPAAVAETTELVMDELDAMTRLIEDMSIVARGEDGSFLKPLAVDPADIVADVAHRVQPMLNGRLRVAPLPERAVVLADPQRLRQALLNLLYNAAVHTRGDGPVELRVVPARRAWRFEVADEGGGLAPGDEEHAFANFWHGPRSSGSGLGLGVVKTIARAHGGSAGVDNRPGKGATFWLTIPK